MDSLNNILQRPILYISFSLIWLFTLTLTFFTHPFKNEIAWLLLRILKLDWNIKILNNRRFSLGHIFNRKNDRIINLLFSDTEAEAGDEGSFCN